MTTNELIKQAEMLLDASQRQRDSGFIETSDYALQLSIASALIAIAKTQMAIEDANHAYMVEQEEAHR